MQRQIRYNVFTDLGEQTRQRHHWVVLVVNETREIQRILERFVYGELAPVGNFSEQAEALIEGSGGLHYMAVSFNSDRDRLRFPENIYVSSNFVKDRSIQDRDDVGWEKYVSRLES
jgi:hypothetical protein